MVSVKRNLYFRYFESACPQNIQKEINTPGFIEGLEKCQFVKIIKT